MLNKKLNPISALLALAFSGTALAAPIQDNFTGASSANAWIPLNYACLTAGDGTGSIPACSPVTDTPGNGALRLTPSANYQTGAILSNFSFPSNQGLEVTFTTYTYNGDSGGTAHDGADGIGFFLTDGGTSANPTPVPTVTGGLGGSLGYSCSNTNSVYNGLANGYLGLGMDEYGNFLNSSDNTSTGIFNSNNPNGTTANGTNSFYNSSNPYYQPNRIGLRGAGNINWNWLSTNYSALYNTASASSQAAAVQNTCRTGYLQNESTGTKQYTASGVSWAGGFLTINVSPDSAPVTVGSIVTITSNSSDLPTSNRISILGTYTVTGVNGSSFTVAFPNGSPSIQHATHAQIAIAVMDYAAIPGGYHILPSSQLIANESASVRTDAWPITYKLIITNTGLLTFLYNYNNTGYQTVLVNQPITASNGPLPSTFRFGFSGSTGGSRNIHEITCFDAQPLQSASSSGANTVESGKVQIGTQVYFSNYSTNNWYGSVVADPLVASNGVLSISNANWDADCVLTGGVCSSMTGSPTITAETPSSRQLLTWNGVSGTALEWANLSSAQQTILNSTDNLGQQRLNWLRGDRSQEQTATPAGPLRARTGVLGDIIDSSPTWVGPPSLNYASPFADALYGNSVTPPENAASAQSYNTGTNSYTATMATRMNVVYSGSNDGFLHGFRAGNYNPDGSYNGTNNDGQELIGYMPSTVLANNNVVGLTNITYGHNYFVDAQPGTGDLFYNNAWHTWLAGGLGPGGAEIYALNITNSNTLATATPSSLVIGDWTPATLTCTSSPGCGSNLGNTYGTPIIRRLHNGNWAIIFGNGLGSSSNHAGIFIGLVNSSSGAITYRWLDTGVGSSSTPDGIAYASSADIDYDHITDYIYAGDLLGNVWRFDLTSSNPADWGVSKFGNNSPTPLYIAKDSQGNLQPITTQIAVATTQTLDGAERVIVLFGTGRKIPATATPSSPDIYATGTQTYYGIWDWDMNKWDNGTTTASTLVIPASSTQYAALTAPQSFTRQNLLAQTSTQTAGVAGNPVLGYRNLNNTNSVCWQGTCTTSTPQYGWYYDFPGLNEQIVYNSIIDGGAVTVNTTIPPVLSTSQCNAGTTTGWTMSFNIQSGGGLPQNFFLDANGSLIPTGNGTSVEGIQINGVGTPFIVTFAGNTYGISQTSTPYGGPSGSVYGPQVNLFNSQGGISTKQVTWEEIR
ncbi:MAG: PilC/PilY family type IV pilus protein [Burkholderiales bacterium]